MRNGHKHILRCAVAITAVIIITLTTVSIAPVRAEGTGDGTSSAPIAKAGASTASGGGGSGSVQPSPFTGAATYGVPIKVPPGRAGVAPVISLNYAGGAGNGIVGMGWSLDMGSIQRNTKNGVDYGANDFIYTNNGTSTVLVPFAPEPPDPGCPAEYPAEYRSKIEEGSFLRFCYDSAGSKWLVFDKNGMHYYFGSSDLSKLDNYNDSSQVFSWMLDKTVDANGNYMTVAYFKAGPYNQIYLRKIEYTGFKTSLLPKNYVKFYYDEDRPDILLSYVPNFAVKTDLRLKAVKVVANYKLVRAYALQYDVSAGTGRSILRTVQEYGNDALIGDIGNIAPGPTPPLPALEFDYTDKTLTAAGAGFQGDIGGPSISIAQHRYPDGSEYGALDADLDVSRVRAGDFNGDGITDIYHIKSWSDTTNDKLYRFNTDGAFITKNGPSTSSNYDLFDQITDVTRVKFGDFNGDGVTDVYVVKGANIGIKENDAIYLYNQDGSYNPPISGPPTLGYTSIDIWRTKLGDFNGDGTTDVMYIDGWHNVYVYVYFFNPDGSYNTTPVTQTDMIFFDDYKVYINMLRFRMGDFNGDGKMDIAWIRDDIDSVPLGCCASEFQIPGCDCSTQAYVEVFLSNGTGFDSIGEIAHFDITGEYQAMDIMRIKVGDFNGDGKTDIMRINSLGSLTLPVWIWFSNGYGFEAAILGPALPVAADPAWGALDIAGVTIADFNGDGMADIVRIPSPGAYPFGPLPILIYLSNGSGFSGYGDGFAGGIVGPYVQVGDPNVYDIFDFGDFYVTAKRDIGRIRFGDFNGDGLMDIARVNGVKTNIPMSLWLNAGAAPDRLNSVDNGVGGTITIGYTPSTHYDNTLLPFPVQTVSSITADDGLGAVSTSTYTYSDGYFEMEDREFGGFGYVKRTNPDLTTHETWYHQRDVIDAAGQYTDDRHLRGKPYLEKFKDPSGTLLTKTDVTWERDHQDHDVYPVFVKLTGKDILTHIGGVWKSNHEVYAYNDANGVVTSVFTSGSNSNEDVTTINTYANYGAWLWRKTSTTVSGSVSGTVRRTESDYCASGDPSPECSGTIGTIKSRKYCLDVTSCNEYLRETFAYTPKGNLATKTDPRENTTTFYYDTVSRTYPVTVLRSPHTVHREYDHRYGAVKTAWDDNGNKTENLFDAFGRVTETVSYVENGPEIAAKAKTWYNDHVFPTNIKTSVLETIQSDGTETYMDKYDYFDGLGRNIQTVTYGEDNRRVVTRTHYDQMGRPYRTEGPFYGYAHLNNLYIPPAEKPWTETTYNHFGKPVTVTSPDIEHGTVIVTMTYSGLSVTATDPDNNKKTEKKDYLGRIIKVTEYGDAGAEYVTAYKYNAAGDLLQVTDAAGNITAMTYDALGRKLSMDDPDMGHWEYQYDANGNLCKQRDAKGRIVKFTFDELDRIETKDYYLDDDAALSNDCLAEGTVSTTDNPVNYTYDDLTVPNGWGRLRSVTNGDVSSRIDEYDAMGRVLSVTKTITGDPAEYTTLTEYDLAGKMTGLTYPDGYNVTYNHIQGTGILRNITGSDGTQFASFSQLEPTGKIGRIDFGNGMASQYTYDPYSTKLLTVSTDHTGNTSSPIDDAFARAYQYTPGGNIGTITDYKKGALLGLALNEFNYDYTYDGLHRLKNETAGETLPEMKNAEHIYDQHPDIAHAFASITVNNTNNPGVYNFTYDANGNTTTGWDLGDVTDPAQRTITYNADNRPVRITYRGNTTDIIYDGAGARAKKTQGTNATYYIGGHYQIINGEPVKHIFAGGLRIAVIKGTETNYIHKDRLGSTIAVTDEAGAIASRWCQVLTIDIWQKK